MGISIARATKNDTADVAVMAGELLNEIMDATGEQTFNFNLDETIARLNEFLGQEIYVVFIARTGGGHPVGFVALCESHALHAEGAFGIIPELYVRPEYRSHKTGASLVGQARLFGTMRGWKRLEVTTPPLPWFDRTLAFYQREGFSIAGGRKLKAVL
jgi:GNAT superfamily N-acetyltransferase